jgi:AraC-like DNA-binding protein
MTSVAKQSELQSTDVHILGNETNYLAVSGDRDRPPSWLTDSPYCEELAMHGIAHAGVMRAKEPFKVVRHDQSGTFMIACLGGEGSILTDGGWRTIRASQACLLPPFVMNSLYCNPGKHWDFAWVRYIESRDRNPVVSAYSPVFGSYEGLPLKSSIVGLHAEAKAEATPATMSLWCDLIHGYVMRFAQPHRSDKRLWKLWKTVEGNPARNWTLAELSAAVSVSQEHLRRLCNKELGRSPMQQVTFIRMQHAARLLATTDEKVDTVCRAIGYSNPNTFSNTFLKWIGRRPSHHGRQGR